MKHVRCESKSTHQPSDMQGQKMYGSMLLRPGQCRGLSQLGSHERLLG